MFADAVRLLLFPAMMAFAASTDLFTMKISNRIPLALAAGFGVLAALDGMPLTDVGSHFAAGAAVLVVCFVFFSRGWIGGGDAKLAAAASLWLGFAHLADFFLYTSILGGVLTLTIIRFRCVSLPRVFVGRQWAERLHRADSGVPYGIALSVAALIVYPQTEWMMAIGR